MAVETMWLKPSKETVGRDQLGARATSVRLYDHLLPGITNVTERARYFSIYSYIIDLWARKEHSTDSEKFRKLIRRTESTLAIADKLVIRETGEPSPGIAGTIRIDRWLNEQPSLPDGRSVPVKMLAEEYFGNKWGAFGQYYSGPAVLLGLIDRSQEIPRLAKPRGVELASTVRTNAERCKLDDILLDNHPNIGQLRKVGEEMAFGRAESKERKILQSILMDDDDQSGSLGFRRRETLLLLLSLASQSPSGISDTRLQVFEAALGNRAGVNIHYKCPVSLKNVLSKWTIYSLHEFLASAYEVLLAAAVSRVREREDARTPTNAQEVAKDTSENIPKSFRQLRIRDLAGQVALSLHEIELNPANDENDEVKLRSDAIEQLANDRAMAALLALKLLCRVGVRMERLRCLKNPYHLFKADGTAIELERLGLDHLSRWFEANAALTIRDAAEQLVFSALATHFRVATAKLAYNSLFTFKVYPNDGELRWVRDVEPAFSQPRLNEARQMLADLGLLKNDSGAFRITSLGVSTLKEWGCDA